jgi:hypothetical protein
MTLEKNQDILPIPEMTEAYARAKSILVDGGIDIQKADELVRICHDKFQDTIKPKIVEEMAKRILRELQGAPGIKNLQELVDRMNEKMSMEIKNFTEIEKDRKNETIYRGPGGIEMKENSLS